MNDLKTPTLIKITCAVIHTDLLHGFTDKVSIVIHGVTYFTNHTKLWFICTQLIPPLDATQVIHAVHTECQRGGVTVWLVSSRSEVDVT